MDHGADIRASEVDFSMHARFDTWLFLPNDLACVDIYLGKIRGKDRILGNAGWGNPHPIVASDAMVAGNRSCKSSVV